MFLCVLACSTIDSFSLDPTSLPAPRTDSSISNAKVTFILNDIRTRPMSSPLMGQTQSFHRSNSLSRQYDEQVKRQQYKKKNQQNTT